MSLINDALKRAKETQQNNPPAPPDLQFRPAEPGPDRNVLPAVLGVLALLAIVGLAGFFVWWTAQSHVDDQPVSIRAVGPPAEVAKASPAPVPAPDPKPAVAIPVAAPETNAVPATSSTPAVDAAAATPTATNTASAVSEVAPPKPAAPRLQGILFARAHPSAVIDGKTVFVGDQVGEYRVVTIAREGVTLTGGGQTIVLSTDQ